MSVVRLEGVGHVYGAGVPGERRALQGVNIDVGAGERVALLGRSGSGKSTLAEILSGVLSPTEGRVVYGQEGSERGWPARLLFQFPEIQLFAPTVLEDVAFGPRNAGLGEERANAAALEALALCRVKPEHHDRAPWSLSDGERRRVALAGILALSPRLVLLDEPEVGLDGEGRSQLEEILEDLGSRGTAVVIATHDAALAARRADRAILLDRGRTVYDGPARPLWGDVERLRGWGVAPPGTVLLLAALARRGWPVRTDRHAPEEAVSEIVNARARMLGELRKPGEGTEEVAGHG